MNKVLEKYKKFFYIACGKPSKYFDREEQVSRGYEFLCMVQWVNLISLAFLINGIVPNSGIDEYFSFLSFAAVLGFPLIVNYFILLKPGKRKIIKELDKFIASGHLGSRKAVWVYAAFTLLFFVFSALTNRM